MKDWRAACDSEVCPFVEDGGTPCNIETDDLETAQYVASKAGPCATNPEAKVIPQRWNGNGWVPVEGGRRCSSMMMMPDDAAKMIRTVLEGKAAAEVIGGFTKDMAKVAIRERHLPALLAGVSRDPSERAGQISVEQARLVTMAHELADVSGKDVAEVYEAAAGLAAQALILASLVTMDALIERRGAA